MAKVWLQFVKNKKFFAAAIAVVILCAVGFQNCSKVNFNQAPASSLSAAAVPQCPGPEVTCTVAHGNGTESCTDSSSGPVYGTCVVSQCDPGFYLSNNQCLPSSFALVVSGGNLSTPVSAFTAIPGQTYDFNISGSSNVVAAGLNNSQSYLKKISGQCSGNSMYQPFTLNLTQAGQTFMFGNNNWNYSSGLADQLGGCVWQLCASAATGEQSCVMLTALANTVTTTTTLAPPTTLPAPTTTVKVTTTTTLSPATTTTTTSTTLHPTTTTTTTLPPVTTTVKVTTTTTLPPATTTTLPPTTTTTLAPTTTTTLPSLDYSCSDGWTSTCGYVLVDNGYINTSNNPGNDAYIRTKPNIDNGAPNQYCACRTKTLTRVGADDCTTLTRYYKCQ